MCNFAHAFVKAHMGQPVENLMLLSSGPIMENLPVTTYEVNKSSIWMFSGFNIAMKTLLYWYTKAFDVTIIKSNCIVECLKMAKYFIVRCCQCHWNGPALLKMGIHNGMELAHLLNDVLLMAQSCLKLMLPIGSSWPSPFLKRQCQWNGIGPAPLKRGIANSMELAQHLPDDALLMAHSRSKVVPPIALS